MASLPLLSAVVGFLRAGHPEGIPVKDYIPLFSLLVRRLSNEEVVEVADALIASVDPPPPPRCADHQRLHAAADLDADTARVSAHLAAGGWPLASPHDEGHRRFLPDPQLRQ